MVPSITMPITSKNQIGQESSNKQHTSEITSSIDAEKGDILTDFLTPEDFSKAVEYHVLQYGGNYSDAILEIAQRLEMEPEFDSEYIRDLIDRPLKEKLYMECVSRRIIREESYEPIDA